ncbi:MAG: hypothetical protein NTY02_12800, partial [Acidobacteria bacterium]|nr:hypothetical protein [Acidobacteriota bacterium]
LALSLHQIGFGSAMDLAASYAGEARDLKPWLADAAINRDRNLRLQYLAGMGLNLQQSQVIYSSMLAYRKPPDIFVGSDATKAWIWEQILNSPGR